MKKQTKIIMILVGIIIILCTVIFVSIFAKSKVNTNMLVEKLSKSSELTTAKLTIKGIKEYDDEGIVILNKSDFTMVYVTEIKAGINLENVKVESDPLKKKIYITIPDAEIIDAKVDPNDIKFYGSGFAFFNVNQKDDVTKAISLAEEDAREYAKTTGLLELANTQAETLIKGILADSIPEGYTIEVKK